MKFRQHVLIDRQVFNTRVSPFDLFKQESNRTLALGYMNQELWRYVRPLDPAVCFGFVRVVVYFPGVVGELGYDSGWELRGRDFVNV